MSNSTWREGGCHCGQVRFRCKIPDVIDVHQCNCSVCWMKQNHHFVVTADNFEILQEQSKTKSTWNQDEGQQKQIYQADHNVANKQLKPKPMHWNHDNDNNGDQNWQQHQPQHEQYQAEQVKEFDPQTSLLPQCTDYRFNTKKARHLFCKHCGVQSFYVPRSNPDGVAVTIYCMDDYQPNRMDLQIRLHQFDGQDWENQIGKSCIRGWTDEYECNGALG